ncbi:oxidoreductase [Mycobacterium dioxanotrophicus]|uniref:Oxidoreductase n=2 Tax=Mycobacterium dioxanotrophicus TaxID=482462 RepID=A0A1Y0CF02_9MYCO|nr:oxidoreductase [Mycobacterium dioxanotrophicus]
MQLRVVAINDGAQGVRVLRLARSDGADLPEWEPGAHLEVTLPGGLRRHYSLCGSRADGQEWTIGVLREERSRGGSSYLHDGVEVGRELTVTGVRNLFPLVPADEYVFIAGGIGITPLLPMIETAEAAGSDWHLFYGGRRRASMAFLERLEPYGERVTVAPADECGRIDLGAALAAAPRRALVYACGPGPLLSSLEEEATAAGLELHVERFTAAPLPASVQNATFEVQLAQTGVTLEVPADRSIVEVLEDNGIGVPSSCQEGVCGTCETKVLQGTPDHRDSILSDEERRAGNTMMICVGRSRSSRLVLDL